jgi:prepilin-type N-terminal cleavage/methylation domain-containing protein
MASTSTATPRARAIKTSGFSLIEMMVAMSIGLILTGVAVMTLQPTLQHQHVNDAYNSTLTALHRAHDKAAADMRVYEVAFSPAVTTGPSPNGGTITVTQFGALTPTTLFTAVLPADVTYHVEPGVPTSSTTAPTTPDGFGTAAVAFDFDQPPSGAGGGATIYFYPDGSAQDVNGNINNGVVYLGMPGQLITQRAVSLWGYTGRVRGWRLTQVLGVWTWSQS